MPNICYINQSSLLPSDGLPALIAALQIQVSRDVAPIWGVDAKLYVATEPAQHTDYVVCFMDHSDQSGDLGYHYDQQNNCPKSKIFIYDTLNDGCSISVTTSHETIEMLVDPSADSLISQVSQGRRYSYVKEACDAVENEQLAYEIESDGSLIKVSDFVTPRYFGLPSGTASFDFCKHLNAGLPTLMPGGYAEYQIDGGAWQSTMARRGDDSYSPRALKNHGRRKYRRSQSLLVPA